MPEASTRRVGKIFMEVVTRKSRQQSNAGSKKSHLLEQRLIQNHKLWG